MMIAGGWRHTGVAWVRSWWDFCTIHRRVAVIHEQAA
jgi:hypothetical protein